MYYTRGLKGLWIQTGTSGLSLSGQPERGRDREMLSPEVALCLVKTWQETYMGSHLPRDGIIDLETR